MCFSTCPLAAFLSHRAQLVKEISRRGGSILPSAPIDGNENMHDRLVDEKTGRTYTRGPVHVVSHPREFRKPNYLLALATGELSLHMFCWSYIYADTVVMKAIGSVLDLQRISDQWT